ncbi:C40 family peptidase [Rossellomorea yichunensis]|jgi:cell wall-associated NlpC family hydrolase|uniref:C40 family peptidase n=1 Tax=Rossellomorea yichunensis TaxID=3077331 RepID=UPI0028E07582|nr:NlpC/P60 family protein [Rossellomorea sp. YC4-1]MDT9026114.1 NlpC/P60 family protein [Rossellomorea sp. YC4-1]
MKKLMTTAVCTVALTFSSVSIPLVQQANAATAPQQAEVEQKADNIISTAKSLIGKATYERYVYNPPHQFGCSGFIYYAFKQNGIDLATRDTNVQAQLGEYVPKDQLQKGDIVFFDSNPNDNDPVTHNGIYIGDNKIIHMADEENDILISDLDGKEYYQKNYKTARRVLPSFMFDQAASSTGEKVVEIAEGLIGKASYGTPYNEETLTFNGAGMTYYSFKQVGIDLKSKTASEQSKLGEPVKRQDLQKGDLVFLSNNSSNGKIVHVGVYAGNDQIVHAAGSQAGIKKSVILNGYYDEHYVTARRVIDVKAADTEDQPETTEPEAPSVEPQPDGQTPTAPQEKPEPETDVQPEEKPENTEDKPAPAQDKGTEVSSLAEDLMGKAQYGYSYDESTMSFNSAGLAYYVFKQNGIDLQDKTAAGQATKGQSISKSQLKKGDLVFFSNSSSNGKIVNTAIYVGNNEVIMSAGKSVGVVKRNLDRSWYQENYVTARRIIQ